MIYISIQNQGLIKLRDSTFFSIVSKDTIKLRYVKSHLCLYFYIMVPFLYTIYYYYRFHHIHSSAQTWSLISVTFAP